MLGYPEAAVEPTWANHRELLTPGSYQRLGAAVARCLTTGEPYCLRLDFVGSGGTLMHVENHGSVAEWRDGKPVRLAGVCVDRTDEKQAFESLRRTTRLLSRTARIARTGGWRLHLRTRRMVWSAEMYRVHGQRRGFDPTLENMLGLYPREGAAGFEQAILRAERGGDAFDLELDMVRSDGSRRRLRVTAEREWENGAVVISGTTQDITTQHGLQTERNLLFSLSQDLLGIADFEGKYTQMNPAWTTLLGWSEGEMLERRWIDLVHPEDVERTLAVGQSLEKGADLPDFSNRLRCRDGSYRTIAWKAVPVMAEGRIVFVARDTTEQVAAQLELDERRLTIDAILEHTLAGYWDWNIERNEETVSVTFRRLFGYGDVERAEWPESWRRLILPEDLPVAREAFRAHLASRGAARFAAELRCRHRDGSVVWVLAAGSVVAWSDQGAPLRMVGCHLDVTKSKQQEAERQRAEQELCGAALAERRRLAFHMHDGVGQSLTALALTAKRLAETKDASEVVREEARSMQRIVSETNRRIRAITRGLVPEEVHAGNFVGAIVRLAEACAAGFQIDCRYAGPAEAGFSTRVAALQVYLIVQEAILNAVRHGEARVVVVGLEECRDDILISIRDDGLGIELDDEATKFHGLGLRSMAARAREVGGALEVSRLGAHGTLVSCRVPRADAMGMPVAS
jgi:PAS domain S-box-containing protein